MQTLPLYHTTGISGFKIKRIRTVARNGKTAEIDGQDECRKAVSRGLQATRFSDSTQDPFFVFAVQIAGERDARPYRR